MDGQSIFIFHISLGTAVTNPNLWSVLENTPKGASIHLIDEGVDTGDLIAQKQVYFDLEAHTLATTYQHLQLTIQELFKEVWPQIKHGEFEVAAQTRGGSHHKIADKQPYLHLLEDLRWDTPVKSLVGRALEVQNPSKHANFEEN